MITKIQAATLYAYGYRLVDKERKEYMIDSVGIYGITIYKEDWGHNTINLEQIGIDYFILARPLEQITQEIEHEGKKFVPLIKLKESGTNKNELTTSVCGFYGKIFSCCDNEEHELRYTDLYGFERRYKYEQRQLNQSLLNEKLYSWHFNIGFPEGTVKPLK